MPTTAPRPRRSRSFTLALAGVLTAASGLFAQPAPPSSAPVADSWRAARSAKLLAILDDYYQWCLKENPLDASNRGDKRYNALLRDDSAEAIARRREQTAARLVQLEALIAVEGSDWGEADRTDADLLRQDLSLAVESAPFHLEQFAVDRLSGPQVGLPQMGDSLGFSSPQDYADFASRLEAVPTAIDQTIANLRAGLKAGRVPPKVVIMGAADQARMIATADSTQTPSLSPFYKPFRTLPFADPSARRAAAAISTGINPAYQRFADFIDKEYFPACRETVGCSQGIDGMALYEHSLRRHTTTNFSAEQIHQIGLDEVARIRANMFKVIARTDFAQKDSLTGDDLFRAFVAYLRTDPRFYCTSADELLAGYRDIAKKVDAALPRLFGTLPRTPYGVRELPAFVAPTSPTAYYYRGSMELGVAGFFMANTYRLDQRPRYEMTALTLHEACPGHHLQIALAQELNTRGEHPFRTMIDCTAFVEGWGLYAERLGLEMALDGSGERVALPTEPDGPGTGLYTDPYTDFGRLTYEMWRACRLVVDTGIHAKGWSRAQAIAYMQANTALSELNIEREIDRYIGWPGQACAYKLGQLKISELRARAEKDLGPKFDIRAFHDCVLSAGAIPLPALELRVVRWIASRK